MKNKRDLIKLISEKAGIGQKQATEVTNHIMEFITNEEGVMITGIFGAKWKNTKEKIGRNPKTGAEVKIPAKRVLRIKASKKLNKDI